MSIRDYDVIWKEQGGGSADSMPVGGHSVGCNVWVQDNQLCLFLGQSGAFDENGTLLKLGRVRIYTENKGRMQDGFCQTLELEKGQILVEAGTEGEKLTFLVWVDVTNGTVHIDMDSEQEEKFHVIYDCWRYRERDVVPEERHQCRNFDAVLEEPLKERVFTRADTVELEDQGLWFYHRNSSQDQLYDRAIWQQGLESAREAFLNKLENRTMGGYIRCSDFISSSEAMGELEGVDQKEYCFTTRAVKRTEVTIVIEVGQYGELPDWKEAVQKKKEETGSLERNQKWWKEYFQRSFIYIDEKNPGSKEWEIGRNFQLFRYMQGCNFYGEYPTKFNGGMFTFMEKFTPDFRMWSGCDFTAQNQRLVYWPMLKNGDFEGMKPQLHFYKDLLEAGKARAKVYWNHEGAYFPEHVSVFGTPPCAEYKWTRREGIPAGEMDAPWVRLLYSAALEFGLMMLEYGDYSGEDITEYLDYIDNVIRFYFAHYEKDENGKLYIFPSTALETYKGDPFAVDREEYGAANPMDAICGLRNLLETLIAYLEKNGKDAGEYKEWLSSCPEMPMGEEGGKKVFLPAEKYNPAPFNCELPQLYHIFPYSYGGLSEEMIEIGRNTYNSPNLNEDQHWLVSWHQDGIFAARMKMTEEAMRVLHFKFQNSEKKFPAFWGPGHDWTPDHNWGGSAMIGLQEMLLQEKGDCYEVLPAWDKAIDVHFRLFLPNRKIVECQLANGEVSIKEERW